MTRDHDRVFVCGEFKRMLKVKAAESGLPLIRYTQVLANSPDVLEKDAKEWRSRFGR